ncbi:MAG: hypothetical protein QME74_03850, partial [Candidatus Edwardsbacteria bacterium]|nr:hypothetical protein [Candidatus Edwardsbacteria bacterium]
MIKIKLICLFILITAMTGCVKKQAVQEPVKPPVAEEPKKAPFAEQPQPAGNKQSEFVGSKGPVAEVWGWRVQIFVSSTVENARKVAEEARWKFGDQQIFIAEAYPYYKVQVG